MTLKRIRDQRQAAAPPYRYSKFPASLLTGTRSDGSESVIASEAKQSAFNNLLKSNLQFVFFIYSGLKIKGRLPRPLVAIQQVLQFQ
ncbi:MAG: hypothetical protein GX797_02755 [Chloroflexi bacterium]|nr:hypothetical protein [Chloroflexota bacterium]